MAINSSLSAIEGNWEASYSAAGSGCGGSAAGGGAETRKAADDDLLTQTKSLETAKRAQPHSPGVGSGHLTPKKEGSQRVLAGQGGSSSSFQQLAEASGMHEEGEEESGLGAISVGSRGSHGAGSTRSLQRRYSLEPILHNEEGEVDIDSPLPRMGFGAGAGEGGGTEGGGAEGRGEGW